MWPSVYMRSVANPDKFRQVAIDTTVTAVVVSPSKTRGGRARHSAPESGDLPSSTIYVFVVLQSTQLYQPLAKSADTIGESGAAPVRRAVVAPRCVAPLRRHVHGGKAN